VVLVDGSASASEILAGAFKDNNRAVLVGTKTFGRGLVQSVRGLAMALASDNCQVLYPSGRDINKAGLPQMQWGLTDAQSLLAARMAQHQQQTNTLKRWKS